MNRIAYRSGYRYQLAEAVTLVLPNIRPRAPVDIAFIRLDLDGTLLIRAGYAWDGATGVPDGPSILRGSLVHDALYQLMREGFLDHQADRVRADVLLQVMCQEDGMPDNWARLVYEGVRLLGCPAADPANRAVTLYAPPVVAAVIVIQEREAP